MAKIGELEVETIKITGGQTLTGFFAPAGGGATIAVTNQSGNPTHLWVTSAGTGTFSISRSTGGDVATLDAPFKRIVIDAFPPSGACTYSWSAAGPAFNGAMVRKA